VSAPVARRNPVRDLVAWLAFTAGTLFVVADIIRLTITGLFILGAVLLAVWLWLIGGFRKEFWDGPDPDPNALTRLDELDRGTR